MCDYHSILGIALGEDSFEIRHLPNNSHADMAGEITNKPLRTAVIFECEWNGEGDLPPDAKLIRNIDECPERLVRKIRNHYIKLKEAMSTGKHFEPGGYFSDTEKWSDVWNAAIAKGLPIVLPEVFKGNLSVSGTAKLDAPALTKVGGDLYVYGTAKLDALTTVGGDLYVYGTAKLDAPALTKVGGDLYVSGTAKLDAPALTKVGGDLYVSGTAKLDALTTVGGNLSVSGTAKLDAPKLTKVNGKPYKP